MATQAAPNVFLRHEGCLKCGSSDARGFYSDGSSFCFSCHDYHRGSIHAIYARPSAIEVDETPTSFPLPDDAGYSYSDSVLQWAGKYRLAAPDLIKHGVVYSPSRQQLIFPFYEDNKNVSNQNHKPTPSLWQARNFGISQTKYFTKGAKEKVLCLVKPSRVYFDGMDTGKNCAESQGHPTGAFSGTTEETCCIVEDCMSAYKIVRALSANGPGGSAMPCLGSTLSRDKLQRLVTSVGLSTRFFVWLDSDMYDKAQQIAQRLAMLGSQVRVVYTTDDPKCYTDEVIRGQLALSP